MKTPSPGLKWSNLRMSEPCAAPVFTGRPATCYAPNDWCYRNVTQVRTGKGGTLFPGAASNEAGICLMGKGLRI